MVLLQIESVKGFFAAGFVIFALILGTFIVVKFFKNGKMEFILVGLTWIGMASLFWGYALNYLFSEFLLLPFDISLMLLFSTGTLSLFHITWTIALTQILYKGKQKMFLVVILIEALIYEITYYILYFDNHENIGTQISPYYIIWSPFVLGYIIITVLFFAITGLFFAYKSLSSDNKEIQSKGKFLTIAFISFAIGMGLELFFFSFDIVIIIARLILCSSVLEFFAGFVLPDSLKRLIMK